ncbi:MAG TPA: hypothetical protein VFU37_19800 [Pyrinomonadaceae bacterium]|nr:hypothetical protein [Pyrinomonadaceae bacterium]
MLFTIAGYYITRGNRRTAAKTPLRALRHAPAMFYRPSIVHKLLCGSSAIYERTRSSYQRARAAS